MSNTTPAGWYSNPNDPSQELYWDGSAWTSNARPAGSVVTAPPPAGSAGNGLGIAAIVLGAVAFIGAFIPFLNYGTGFIALIGLILGIVGLFVKNKRRGTAIAGTILSAVAGVLSIILAIVYTAGFVAAAGDSVTIDKPSANVAPSDTPSEGSSDVPSEGSSDNSDLGTRKNPAPYGTAVTISTFEGPVWEVTAGKPTWDATAEVKAANTFNADPESGHQYAILPVKVKYVGDDSGRPFDLEFKFVSSSGQSFDGAFVVMDGQLSDVDELLAGATGSGNVVIEIPTANAAQGAWSIQYILSDDKVYVGNAQ